MAASMELIARLPGATVGREADLTWLASGRPYSSLNHVQQIDLSGSDESIDERIEAVHERLTSAGSVPATWWVGPATRPVDLGRRLLERGFVEAEPEFGMAIGSTQLGTARRWPRASRSSRSPGRPTSTTGCRSWPAPTAGRAGERRRSGPSFTARRSRSSIRPGATFSCATAAARSPAASIFYAGGLAFVTNIGTVPEARGRGLGTVATRAALLTRARQRRPPAREPRGLAHGTRPVRPPRIRRGVPSRPVRLAPVSPDRAFGIAVVGSGDMGATYAEVAARHVTAARLVAVGGRQPGGGTGGRLRRRSCRGLRGTPGADGCRRGDPRDPAFAPRRARSQGGPGGTSTSWSRSRWPSRPPSATR